MITVRADMPQMDGNITMTCEPIFEEGVSINTIGSRIDPDWKYTDPAGHKFQLDGFYKSVHDTEYWCEDCGDMHGDGIWLCNECGARIKPRMISGATMWNMRVPDRYLGMKTTLVYQDNPASNTYRHRTWVFNNDELTQKILDRGSVSDEVLEALGNPDREELYSW